VCGPSWTRGPLAVYGTLAIMSVLPCSERAVLTVVGWSLPDRMHSAMAVPSCGLFSLFCLLAVFGKLLTLYGAVVSICTAYFFRSTNLPLDSESVYLCSNNKQRLFPEIFAEGCFKQWCVFCEVGAHAVYSCVPFGSLNK
jgi:hypothetical protein